MEGSNAKGIKNRVVSPSGEIIELPKAVSFDPTKHQIIDAHSIECGENDNARDNLLLQRHVSLELLNPTYECNTRKSSMMVAIINLVATTCGGGVLSLPLAFRRAGIIPTTVFMIYGVLTTDFSLYILVSCARRTGGRSYGDVAKSAFGDAAEIATTSLLGFMLIGSLTAYLVLVKDIWSPVVLSLLPKSTRGMLACNDPLADDDMFDSTLRPSRGGSNLILLCIVVLGSPLLLKNDLHALRHTCYIGFTSCTLLMVAVVYRAIQALQSQDPGRASINWYSTNLSDYAFAFPIVVLCFFCSYNVLGVHSSLLDPTRFRIKYVLDTSMLICFFLFYSVGLCGYLYALDDTRDNILLNFPMNDPAILLGRMGFCFTLLFGLPLVTLPCREAFRAIPPQIRSWRVNHDMTQGFREVDLRRKGGAHLVINGVDFDELEPLVVTEDPEKQHLTMLTYGATHEATHIIGTHDDETATTSEAETLPLSSSSDDMRESTFDLEPVLHFVTTFALVGVCFTFAISVPGVGFVWSLAGSSMAILIAFVIPTSCYLKVRQHKKLNPRSIAAWGLLLISCIAAPICTQQAIANN